MNPIIDFSKLNIFFVIGRTRSGTTLIRNIFDAHPNVSIPTEIPFIPFTFKKFGSISDWDNEVIDAFVDCISSFRKFANLQISTTDLKAILQEARDSNKTFTYKEAIKVLAYAYPSAFKKEYILTVGDKSPAYSMFPEKLNQIFPEAKFIAIVRDYRDVAASVKKIDFELPYTSIISLNWKKSQQRILKLHKENPNRVLIVKYEDFVKNSEEKLKQILDFLNLPIVPSVLTNFNQPQAMEKEFKTAKFDKHHKSLKEPINTGHIENWRKSLKPMDIRIADAIVGKWAELSGYKRVHKSFDIVAIIYSIPALFLRLFIHLLIIFIHKLPSKVRGKFWAPGEIIAKIYYKFKREKRNGKAKISS